MQASRLNEKFAHFGSFRGSKTATMKRVKGCNDRGSQRLQQQRGAKTATIKGVKDCNHKAPARPQSIGQPSTLKRERESERVCVCVCERERERERDIYIEKER